jgi:hypothetical protein
LDTGIWCGIHWCAGIHWIPESGASRRFLPIPSLLLPPNKILVQTLWLLIFVFMEGVFSTLFSLSCQKDNHTQFGGVIDGILKSIV